MPGVFTSSGSHQTGSDPGCAWFHRHSQLSLSAGRARQATDPNSNPIGLYQFIPLRLFETSAVGQLLPAAFVVVLLGPAPVPGQYNSCSAWPSGVCGLSGPGVPLPQRTRAGLKLAVSMLTLSSEKEQRQYRQAILYRFLFSSFISKPMLYKRCAVPAKRHNRIVKPVRFMNVKTSFALFFRNGDLPLRWKRVCSSLDLYPL